MDVPVSTGEAVFHYVGNLGQWLHNQRHNKKGKVSNQKLSIERKALLQKLVDEGKLIVIHFEFLLNYFLNCPILLMCLL